MATAGEELYESEVLWPDHQAPHDVPPPARAAARRGQTTCHATASSLPVDIPRAAARQWSGGADLPADDSSCGGVTMVPPHVMVSRRRSEGEAFSLRSGTGRATRRDLSHPRNSVLRMTGFIEG